MVTLFRITHDSHEISYHHPKQVTGDGVNMIKIHLSRILGEQRVLQADLAKRTGIRKATINEMYHELIERVNLDYLSRICEALGCEVGDILEYVPDKRDYELHDVKGRKVLKGDPI